jgi:flagellar M-ring protein FliF
LQNLFRSLVVQFREFYKNLTPTKRFSMLMASMIVTGATIFMVFMMSGTDYAPLFTNVASDQTSVVMSKLQARNIPFKIEDGGKTILIPKELLSSTQMALMAEIGNAKIGTLGSGLEIFDKQDFGTTSYAQRINYQRALQGELVRAINTLDAVKQSKVILALPPKKTFLEEGSQPTASVVLELNGGKTLAEEQVRGITFLVSSAVEGLEPERVTVVDSRGKVLSKPHDASSVASGELEELKIAKQKEIEERVESILSKVVGQGKIIARVDATLNQQQAQTTEETVDAEKTAVLSTVGEDESVDGSRTNPTGIPGARSNLPGATDTGSVGFNQNVKKEMKTTNYAVPKTVRNTKEAAGALQRVSIAVLVDGSFSMKKNEKGEDVETYQPRTPEELAKFENIVKNAIGFNEKRGDTIKVENMEFQKEDFSETERLLTTLERKKLVNALLKWTLLGAALAFFFFIVIRPFMRWITDSFQDSVEDMLPRTIEELEELQSVDNSLPGMSSALPILEESLDPDKAESQLLRERIVGLMDRDEEKAAGAFSLWLVRRDG